MVICVTPYVGVWIETPRLYSTSEDMRVTPYVGVWIETCGYGCLAVGICHSLCGSVD